MQRFFGLMPSNEIEIEKTFLDRPGSHYKEQIQAGPNGWSIIWADGGSDSKDESKGTEANYEEAYKVLLDHFPNATEIVEEDLLDVANS